MHDEVVHQIVSQRQQRADKYSVALCPFGKPRIAVADRRQLLGIESALGTGRHDHRILDHLSLHQTEDFRSEIVAPVRPADAAASDGTAATWVTHVPR